jgi:hypothetical protein
VAARNANDIMMVDNYRNATRITNHTLRFELHVKYELHRPIVHQ